MSTSLQTGSQILARPHLADGVFESIATDILRGTVAPGDTLPPERVLARRFGTTRIVARQAIHRLADLGMVRTRQGGATRVEDVDGVTDLRVVELLYRLDPQARRWPTRLRDIVEKQYLQGLCLVEIAVRRGTIADRRAIADLVDTHAPTAGGEAEVTAFEQRFWTAVARIGGNRIFRMEVGFWYRIFAADHPRPPAVRDAPLSIRIDFYRELARRMCAGEDAVGFYTQAVTPILAAMDAG